MATRIDGVVLLDKPAGMSSQGAVTAVKRAFNADKAGHTGTLDPMATGLLPICLGEATKYSQDLLDADKTYIANVKFGARTDTGDAEGQIIEEFALPIFASELELQQTLDALLPKFTGPISQVPPMYSALKRDGKPLYEYARAGVELERTARDITIHHIRWIDIQWPQATLEVSCSKGTYIRVLAEDIGNALGCGAHLVGLRRTEVGHLTLEQSFTLESIQQALHDSSNYILPVDALLQTLPHLTVDEQQAKRLEMGQRVPLNLPSIEALVRIYRATAAPHNFIGTADWRSGVLHPKRLISQAH
ncbi:MULTISPECIES: tRNA pseudouridine(55) synthase TruB [unclassified Polynucleobacter]|jgi:tRNA pseudouridine55 synthase|uniref:tRNA pseudouridine(55) synthase TruB n=1 Tax=unclassified Polynucleobacter TaxID=2640945 RepID=UPI001BFE75F8|nr:MULTISPECIES: tRNA pseudouridine(55) synthase TruB [unclassified Polynucleobacter]MBU3605196.1 tRNA pseudouridine(55) synthase TruB [Polynucleobacter sp. MWH-Creno-3A4]QWD77394.1 tRNA pseudouridine(55) synthase TruB [Polynucleobacter sp. MWH-Svant-W18]